MCPKDQILFDIGVTIEGPHVNVIYYLEAKAKKTRNSWHLFQKNIKGFSVDFEGPQSAIICNIKNKCFVGLYYEAQTAGEQLNKLILISKPMS